MQLNSWRKRSYIHFVVPHRHGAAHKRVCCNFNLRTESQAGAISILNLSGTGITCVDVAARDELAQQLLKFSALKQLYVSGNPGLDLKSISCFLKGKNRSGKRHYTLSNVFQMFSCLHFLILPSFFFRRPRVGRT
jgi:hypothetical protein